MVKKRFSARNLADGGGTLASELGRGRDQRPLCCGSGYGGGTAAQLILDGRLHVMGVFGGWESSVWCVRKREGWSCSEKGPCGWKRCLLHLH